MKKDLPKALMQLRPGAKFSLIGNDLSGLTWLDDRPVPTESELEIAYTTQVNFFEDWTMLTQKLGDSALFLKIYKQSKLNLAVKASFDMFREALMVTQNKEWLSYFLNDLRVDLGVQLTTKDITEVNKIFADCGFDIAIN